MNMDKVVHYREIEDLGLYMWEKIIREKNFTKRKRDKIRE